MQRAVTRGFTYYQIQMSLNSNSLNIALLPPSRYCLCMWEDGLALSHSSWPPSPLPGSSGGSQHSPRCAGLLSNSSNFLLALSQCFVVSFDVVRVGSGPEGGWPYAETPGYLMAKPEISCAPARAS